MPTIKILALGDIVGPASVEYIRSKLFGIIKDNSISFTVANGENACIGNGLDPQNAKILLNSGVDVITSGNHIWHKKELREYMDQSKRVLRPANYRSTAPGQGYTVYMVDGYRYLVMNVMGTMFLEPLENPFYCIDRVLEHAKGSYDFSILDIHAEATSEKYALARYFDGRINVIFGTHTHIPTADNQVLRGGSGFVCDLGMCGPVDSILGVKNECIIEKFMTNIPLKFELAGGEISAQGVIFTLDTDSGRVTSTERITF